MKRSRNLLNFTMNDIRKKENKVYIFTCESWMRRREERHQHTREHTTTNEYMWNINHSTMRALHHEKEEKLKWIMENNKNEIFMRQTRVDFGCCCWLNVWAVNRALGAARKEGEESRIWGESFHLKIFTILLPSPWNAESTMNILLLYKLNSLSSCFRRKLWDKRFKIH